MLFRLQGQPLLQSSDLPAPCTKGVQLLLDEPDGHQDHVLYVIYLGLRRVSRVDFHDVLYIFLKVFYLGYDAGGGMLDFDGQDIVVDTEQHLQI